jgi:NAD(P)H-dependent FMN reductase
MELSIYDALADIPPFNPDLDLDGDKSPLAVRHLRQLLQSVDGILICTPEYAFGVPGVLKNALDWLVSTGELSGKPVATISASSLWTGGDKAHESLLLTLTALGAKTSAEGKLLIPTISKKLNEQGEVLDPDLTPALKAILDALAHMIEV